MTSSHFDDYVRQVEDRLGSVVETVLQRGYDDVSEELDDYAIMITQFEFRKVVTFQLYEVLFSNKAPRTAVEHLMGRLRTHEIEEIG